MMAVMMKIVKIMMLHLVVREYRQDADRLEVGVRWMLGQLLRVFKCLFDHIYLSLVALCSECYHAIIVCSCRNLLADAGLRSLC